MKNETLIGVASLLGMLSVIFGAFGAHYLKTKLSSEGLASFEIGVKYQMYHALLLFLIALTLKFGNQTLNYSVYLILIGVFFFSFSIYGLVLSPLWGNKWSFLGPITPIGGLLLILGWGNIILQSFNGNISLK